MRDAADDGLRIMREVVDGLEAALREFAGLLREWRTGAGLTQRQAACMFGMPVKHYRRIERGA